jgi:polysaccharide export outer membrane protein
MKYRKLSLSFCVLGMAGAVLAQETARPREAPTNYILGPDDQIAIQVPDAEDISDKPVRIDMRGNISLPMVGRLHATGLTAEELEVQIRNRLKKYLQEPDVTVSITEFKSQPISIFGAVQKPGVHQLQGRKNLFEVLSLAEGLRTDAGYSIKITRRLEWGRLPLPGATDDPTGHYSVASVNIKSIMNATNPAENIIIKPEDVISVPKADLVYVIGTVHKSGGFVLGEHETISALEALALAEGLDRAAAPQNAKILRASQTSASRTEIPIDIKKILTGRSEDIALKADDILFIPASAARSVAIRSLETAVQIGTGVVIYRR